MLVHQVSLSRVIVNPISVPPNAWCWKVSIAGVGNCRALATGHRTHEGSYPAAVGGRLPSWRISRIRYYLPGGIGDGGKQLPRANAVALDALRRAVGTGDGHEISDVPIRPTGVRGIEGESVVQGGEVEKGYWNGAASRAFPRGLRAFEGGVADQVAVEIKSHDVVNGIGNGGGSGVTSSPAFGIRQKE